MARAIVTAKAEQLAAYEWLTEHEIEALMTQHGRVATVMGQRHDPHRLSDFAHLSLSIYSGVR
jgi:hypothetical protein